LVTITFWFDPTCPFTWRTSRWLRDTAARNGERVRWRFLSLALLNEGREVPEQHKPALVWGRHAHRVLAAAEERHGQDAVDRLYTAVGQRVHERDAQRDASTLSEAIAEAGLAADLADAADDAEWDKVVRASHEQAQARVGTETGSPVTAIDDGPGFFGPVVVPIPDADAADRLLEALRLLSTVPQFSELKRVRDSL
jgi:2-hydroxychromene-2-carboxylate isomerase